MESIKDEVRQVLLGNWLCGDHLNDMDMFEPHHCGEYGGIVKAMKDGQADIIEISKLSGVSLLKLSEFRKYGNDKGLYEVGVMNMQPLLAKEWLAENPDASPDEIAKNMKRFSKKLTDLPSPSSDPVGNFIEELDRRKAEKPVGTSIPSLDRMLCGVRKKELTAVGARPSVGKSALLEQIAVKVARQGKKVLFFPLEMSEMSIVQRMVMQYTDIPQYEMRNGLNRETWEKASHGFDMVDEFFSEGNFLIFERCNDISVIKRLIEFHKPYMVAIDQLEQLTDGNKSWIDKRARFSYMTHEMQAISLDMDVAVWFACQANRGADNEPPTMANLKESGTIEEDSTNVLLLHRESEKVALQDMRLELAKQKDGECGVLKLKFDAPHFKFYEKEYY